jgi:outer membrane protein OmpA-like peptidoglycan-associated protein
MFSPSVIEHLDESARLLNVCVERQQPVGLNGEPFSDKIGDAKINLDLSTTRFEAVRKFPVRAGIPSNLFVGHGYGAAKPIAGNLTERGPLRIGAVYLFRPGRKNVGNRLVHVGSQRTAEELGLSLPGRTLKWLERLVTV